MERVTFRFLTGLVWVVAVMAAGVAASLLAGSVRAEVSAMAAMGYAPDDKLLIIHADDIGMSHSVNVATFRAMKDGAVNSGSMMVPCGWFTEAAAHFRAHPELDLGLHLTLTAEWKHYKWGGLAGAGAAYTLHDALGHLYPDVPEVVQHASADDVAREIAAQVEAARAQGILPTHLDSHMGTLFADPAFFAAYVATGRRYRLPILAPRETMAAQAPQLLALLKPDEVLVDRLFMADPSVPADGWDAYYTGIIENLQPGVTEIIIHAGLDDTELQAITVEHPDYGARWRQKDTDYFARPEVRALLRRHDVKLITWREFGRTLYPDTPAAGP